jgi:hypothetical protein
VVRVETCRQILDTAVASNARCRPAQSHVPMRPIRKLRHEAVYFSTRCFCSARSMRTPPVAYTRLMELQPPPVPFLGLTGPAQPANLPSPPCSQTPRNPSPKSMQDYVLNHHQPLPTVLSGNRPGCSSHHQHLTRIKSRFAVLSRWPTHEGQLGRRRLSPPADRGTDECAKGTVRKNLRTPGPVHLRPAA